MGLLARLGGSAYLWRDTSCLVWNLPEQCMAENKSTFRRKLLPETRCLMAFRTQGERGLPLEHGTSETEHSRSSLFSFCWVCPCCRGSGRRSSPCAVSLLIPNILLCPYRCIYVGPWLGSQFLCLSLAQTLRVQNHRFRLCSSCRRAYWMAWCLCGSLHSYECTLGHRGSCRAARWYAPQKDSLRE